MYTCFDRFWDSDFGWGNRGVIWNLNFWWKSATLFCFCFNNKLNFDNFEFHRVLTGSLMTNWNKIIKVSKYILNYFCASWPCLKQGDHLKLKLLMRISNPFLFLFWQQIELWKFWASQGFDWKLYDKSKQDYKEIIKMSKYI